MTFVNSHSVLRTGWRYQPLKLLVAVLVCILLPYLLVVWGSASVWKMLEARNTAILASFALVGGLWLKRSASQLPGTSSISAILPSFLVSFGAALAIILIFRINYSRAMLVSAFLLSLGLFYFLHFLKLRQSHIVLGVIDGGAVSAFSHMPGIRTVMLSPDQSVSGLDAVVADFRYPHSSAIEAQIADITIAGVPVYHSKDLLESLTGRVELEHLSENNFGTLGPLNSYLSFKMVVDFLMAAVIGILLSPALLLVALAVRLDSPGPALFRQERMGYRGRSYRIFKFRTMRAESAKPQPADGAVSLESLMTAENDHRITRLGRFLRRSRIDELPQIINILRGEMSWIGPRPEATGLSGWYENQIPFYRYRHVVRPGITGWAQVSQGHVTGIEDIRLKLQYDFYYIRNFSLWLDILITMKTIKTMLTGFGHK